VFERIIWKELGKIQSVTSGERRVIIKYPMKNGGNDCLLKTQDFAKMKIIV